MLPSRQPAIRKKLAKKKARPLFAGSGAGSVAMAVEAVGFPGGVLVVLGHVAVDAAQVAVVDAAADQAHRAGELRVFMHLHVALRPVVFLDAFVFHLAHTEEGELAQGVTTTQPAAKEVVGVAEQKALMGCAEKGGSEGGRSGAN